GDPLAADHRLERAGARAGVRHRRGNRAGGDARREQSPERQAGTNMSRASTRSVALAVAWRSIHNYLTNPAFLVPSIVFPLFFFTAFAGGLSTIAKIGRASCRERVEGVGVGGSV